MSLQQNRRGGNAALAILCGLPLFGCATAPIHPSAVTRYSVATCAPAPELAGAISLTPPEKKKNKKIWSVTKLIDSSADCIDVAGKNAPYVVFEIPAASEQKIFEVGAPLEPVRIFSPQISILNADGFETRNFGPDKYLFRGWVYSVQFQPQAGERYILVRANTDNVGKRYDSIFTGVNATSVYTGYGAATYYTGIDEAQSRVFSYEGNVIATVHEVEKIRK